jgi:hypothetical protein
VLDPDLSKDYLVRIQNRTKEKKYCFDHAFGPNRTNVVCCIFHVVKSYILYVHFD